MCLICAYKTVLMYSNITAVNQPLCGVAQLIETVSMFSFSAYLSVSFLSFLTFSQSALETSSQLHVHIHCSLIQSCIELCMVLGIIHMQLMQASFSLSSVNLPFALERMIRRVKIRNINFTSMLCSDFCQCLISSYFQSHTYCWS